VRKRSIVLFSLLVFVLSAGFLSAQAWTLKDSGVGLVVQDADYARVLKIAERGNAWDLEDLYAKGALAAGTREPGVCRVAGGRTDTYLNTGGLPI